MLSPYLPYFSNCNTFDSYIPFWLLVEAKECELPEGMPDDWPRYKFPALPDQDDIKPVSLFDIGAYPVADYCTRKLFCHYEEDLPNPDNTPRWYATHSLTLSIIDSFSLHSTSLHTGSSLQEKNCFHSSAIQLIIPSTLAVKTAYL